MKTGIYYSIFLVLGLLTLTSCFEIIEEVTIYPDGKGEAGVTVNLSQGKTKLSSIMLMDSIKGNEVPSKQEIVDELENAKEIAAATPGISEVNLKVDFDNFIFEMNCRFDSVECLNHVINNIENAYTTRAVPLKTLFTYKNNTYFRNADYLVPNKHKKTIDEEKGALLSAKYISIVRLPFEVAEMSNENAKLAKNKKAVMLRVNGDKLLENTHSVTNNIKIQP